MNKKQNIVRTENLESLVNAFVAHLETEQLRGLGIHGVDCEANRANRKTSVKWGKAWIKVDVGGRGAYMVDANGDIFGIKAYGVPHLGHRYGNLETVFNWDWSDYTPFRKELLKASFCPDQMNHRIIELEDALEAVLKLTVSDGNAVIVSTLNGAEEILKKRASNKAHIEPIKSWEESSIQNQIDSAKVPASAHLLPGAESHIPAATGERSH
jgi:hypothetical protein